MSTVSHAPARVARCVSVRKPAKDSRRNIKTRAKADGLSTLLGATIIAPGGDVAVRESVQKYYGETLSTSEDLKTSACCTPGDQIPREVRDALRDVPDEVKAKYYGCGSPTPTGIEGLRVLDLGSGSGRDCYVAARLVGTNGSVTGGGHDGRPARGGEEVRR